MSCLNNTMIKKKKKVCSYLSCKKQVLCCQITYFVWRHMKHAIKQLFADTFNICIYRLARYVNEQHFPHCVNRTHNPGGISFPTKHICCCKLVINVISRGRSWNHFNKRNSIVPEFWCFWLSHIIIYFLPTQPHNWIGQLSLCFWNSIFHCCHQNSHSLGCVLAREMTKLMF